MQTISQVLALLAILLLPSAQSDASTTIAIKPTDKAPLFDGQCAEEEWQGATTIEFPAQISVHLMRDEDSLFVCAKGKAEDYTGIDLYIEHAETGQLHNLHVSAQLGERLFTNNEWGETPFWNLDDWGGFWVPFAGTEDSDNGTRPTFLRGSDREIQILRRKFAGNTWNMMISVSGVHDQGEYGAEFSYPESAVNTDVSTWGAFSF